MATTKRRWSIVLSLVLCLSLILSPGAALAAYAQEGEETAGLAEQVDEQDPYDGEETGEPVDLLMEAEAGEEEEIETTPDADGEEPPESESIDAEAQAAAAQSEGGVQSVRALTEVAWWGQRVIGVILEFTQEVDASKLAAENFAVRDTSFNPYFDSGSYDDPKFMEDQQVVDVFTVADPQQLLDNDRPEAPGKYVVVLVEPNFNGGTKISVNGGMMANPDQPTEITIGADIYATSGDVLAQAGDEPLKLTGPAAVNRGFDQFIHGIEENPSVGLPLNYHYRLPDNYDPDEKYPLVVYFNGNGQGYFPAADNIGGQLICDGTPQFWFGEQDVPVGEDVIFLAPQNTRSGQTTQIQAEQAAELIENFSKEFAVDTQRIYGYSLSAGSGLGWWVLENRSDLFAGFIQTGFMANTQAQAEAIAAAPSPVPIWLFQGQYDHLFGSANAVASYQRIADAYEARGYTAAQIDELIKITVLPDSAFEPQGPGLHTPSGPFASLNPDLPGPRIDRHAPMVPAFQDPETSEWLLSQRKDDKSDGIQSVRALTDLGWWGQQVTGVIVEFSEDVDITDLTINDVTVRDTFYNASFDGNLLSSLGGNTGDPFFMRDQPVADIFTVADPGDLLDNEKPQAPGRYVVVTQEPNYNGWTKLASGMAVGINPNQPTEITFGKDIYSTSGNLLATASEDPLKLTGPAAVNRKVDHFVHGYLENPTVGLPLNYHYRLPENYDPEKEYPLVVYLTGMGQGYYANLDNVGVHITTEGSSAFWFGEMGVPVDEDVIVLAPQSTRSGNTVANQAAQVAELIELFSKEFSVDTDRVYAYTLSYGAQLGWWLAAERNDLFAAIMPTSMQATATEAQARLIAEAELPLWLHHATGDHLTNIANARTSYQRIVNAYKALGYSDARIDELIMLTEYPDEAFDILGDAHPNPPPSGGTDGTRWDRHISTVPTLKNPETSKWLLAQVKTPAAALTEGATVTEDPDSPTGYIVTFVYKNEHATAVRLAGDLTMRDVNDTTTTWYQPENYQTGRYHVGGTEFLRDMTSVGDGYWTVSIPMHAGGLSYWYRVDDPTQNWNNKRIWDPAGAHPRPEGTSTYRVNNNDVLGAVYVPYHEKQDNPVLQSRAEYELPVADAEKSGSVQYVEYTNVLGNDGGYLGVYLPAGYDENREEPYKVMYLAHGIFGDETDWMVPGNAPNILDNMIAKGEIEPTVLVSMGNHFVPSSGLPSYNQETAARNLVEAILPFVEENYNVSTEREGRAYGGFSYGGMTGGHVINNYHSQFGYFGYFSGNPSSPNYSKIAEEAGANVPFVMLGNGTFEGTLNNQNNIRDNFRNVGIPSETHAVYGAHDMMTAGQLFTIFAREYLWQQAPVVYTEGATVEEDENSPTGYTVTFVYKNENATAVRLAGDLTLRDVNDTTTTWYQPENWQTGRYHVGGTEFLRDMTPVGDGYWTVSIPMHAGGLSYWYRVDDPSQDWNNKRIWDPVGPHPRPEGTSTYRVNNNDVLGAVYVPYHEKQNDPVLESRAEYELPIADSTQSGTVQYVEYTNVLGNDGEYLGVYLPAGYDENREEPYKVMYLAHGIYGDETDWMVPGNTPNILDNMIAKGEIEPTILVSMGNHFVPNSNGLPSYDRETAARNLVEAILPFVEANYNVSTEREGRAYGGFSYGGSTGGYVINNYHNLFGYFGYFSGSPASPNYAKIAEEAGANVPFVMLGNGTFEGTLNSVNNIRNNFRNVGIPSETHAVRGAHDMMTAGQLFTIFAREYLWTDIQDWIVPVTSINLNAGSLNMLSIGKTLELNPTITPDNATNQTVTYTSNNPNVASVDANGVVTAHKTGTAMITATASSGKVSKTTVRVTY